MNPTGLYGVCMPQATPRIPALSAEELTDEQTKQLGGFTTMSFPRVMMRHPGLNKTLMPLLAEIAAARSGAGPELSDFDLGLVSAAEKLVADQRIGDDTWQLLARRYSQVEMMKVVGLVGCYVMMTMFTKSCGVELEDEQTFNAFAEKRQYT